MKNRCKILVNFTRIIYDFLVSYNSCTKKSNVDSMKSYMIIAWNQGNSTGDFSACLKFQHALALGSDGGIYHFDSRKTIKTCWKIFFLHNLNWSFKNWKKNRQNNTYWRKKEFLRKRKIFHGYTVANLKTTQLIIEELIQRQYRSAVQRQLEK